MFLAGRGGRKIDNRGVGDALLYIVHSVKLVPGGK